MAPYFPQAVGHTNLKWSRDKWFIACLSQKQKEAWYAAQNPDDLVVSSKEFKAWWERWYGGHVKVKRFLYKFKFW